MSDSSRVISGGRYRQAFILNPGQNLYFTAGRTIAIETWALEWGKHEFDYELNSRRLNTAGRPEAIATTREALQREFLERRVVSRYPIPVSVAMNGIDRLPDVSLTLGEARPQVYTSRIEASRIAWSLHFRTHRHYGAVGGKRASRGRATNGSSAPGTGRAGGMPTDFDYLMVHVPAADFPNVAQLRGGFGTTDVIGYEPGFMERWIARVAGQ